MDSQDQLVTSGLSGAGLIPVRSPLLVSRYNDCLIAAGIEPTKLETFDIDGKGWSPQIAAEKNNEFYLSHGGAVHYAIILSPDQGGKPVYRPFYSFERAVIDSVFATKSKAVADLTSRAGIWLEIDPGVVRFDKPEDISLVESVTVTFADTAGIMEAATEQQKLVARFSGTNRAWSDAGLRQKIIGSAKKNGDFRFREVLIPPIKVSDLDYFYAEIFGGTFVLRNSNMNGNLLVVDDNSADVPHGLKHAYHPSDESLVKKLFAEGMVEIPIDWYRNHPESISDLCDTMLAEAIYYEGRNKVDFSTLNPSQKKRYALEFIDMMPKEFPDLEKFLRHIVADKDETKSDDEIHISKKLRLLLMRPHHMLTESEAKVVWRLITKMTTVSLTDLYLYAKPSFFAKYREWPELRQKWAIKHLAQRGICPYEGDSVCTT